MSLEAGSVATRPPGLLSDWDPTALGADQREALEAFPWSAFCFPFMEWFWIGGPCPPAGIQGGPLALAAAARRWPPASAESVDRPRGAAGIAGFAVADTTVPLTGWPTVETLLPRNRGTLDA